MQIQPTPAALQQPGKPALRSGIIIGITLGIIHSVMTIIITQMNVNATNNPGGNSYSAPTTILYLITPLIWIVGFLVAGTWAGRETGKISTGVFAGLFAGTFGGIIAGIGQAIATTIATSQQHNAPVDTSLLLFSGYAAVFYVMVLALGAGAGFGVLGGLIGQSMSNVRPQPAAQPVYAQPVMPYTYVPVQPPQVPLPPQPQTPQPPQMGQLPEQ